MVQWTGTGWDSNIVLGEGVEISSVFCLNQMQCRFCHQFALGLVASPPCKFWAANQHPGFTSWESHRLTWEHQFAHLKSPTPGLKPTALISLAEARCYPWYRACHPQAPDTAQLPKGPAPHSGPASLGIVSTLIRGLGRGSAEDKPHTSRCPSPPIAGLQSWANK